MKEGRFQPDPLLAARVVEDRAVLVPLARSDSLEDNVFVLEGASFRAWTLLAAGRSLAQVRASLLAAYEVSAEALEADLTALVEALLECRILINGPAPE